MNVDLMIVLMRGKPLCKSGYGRQRDVALGVGITFADFFDHLFDQEVTKRDAG